jgi:hypothetical protein
MAAEIIPFPKKEQPLKRASSIDLYYCWDSRLNNPLLNRLYKTETCYVERWYLQLQHLLNEENTSHPLMQLVLSPQDTTLNYLIESTEKDLAVQRYFSDVRNADAAQANVVRLNRWLTKWQSLLRYRQGLYSV